MAISSLRALALYLGLTIVLTWPLALHLHRVDAGDSAFFAWTIGWELHALGSRPSALPHANIYHPLRYTLGMDEPVLGTTLLALPLLPFTRDPVVLFNAVRLLTFAFSALSAYWLARGLGCREVSSLVAGAAFAFSPIRTDQIAHLSTLGTQWLPLAVLFVHRVARTAAALDAALAGLFFVLTALACGYYGVIGLAVLPPAVLVLFWGRWRRVAAPALLGLAVAAAGLVPVYLLHRAALQPLGYIRGREETVFYSAALETFLAVSARNHVWGELLSMFRTTRANNLFPGLMLPLVVLLAAWRLRQRSRPVSRDAIALAVMALAAAVVALGPEVRFYGRTLFPGPFALAREMVPVFQMIRVTSRAGVFLALPLAILAAKALDTLAVGRWRSALIGLIVLAESAIAPIAVPRWTQVVDTSQPPPAVYEWLRSQPGELAVVELPMLDIYGIFARPAYHESVYMVRSTRHWKRLVNGYAGVEPPGYGALREMARQFPSAALLSELRRLGVRYVIVHRGGYGPNRWARLERELPGFAAELREVARLDGDRVYELLAAPSPGSPP